jgi:hypothetical protein
MPLQSVRTLSGARSRPEPISEPKPVSTLGREVTDRTRLRDQRRRNDDDRRSGRGGTGTFGISDRREVVGGYFDAGRALHGYVIKLETRPSQTRP